MFCKWESQLNLPSTIFMVLEDLRSMHVEVTEFEHWCDKITLCTSTPEGGSVAPLDLGCSTCSTPFFSLLPPSSSLPHSPLFSDHSSTAERHASHFDHRTRGGERGGGREGARERERGGAYRDRVSCSRTSALMLKNLTFIPWMERQVSQPLESEQGNREGVRAQEREWTRMCRWASEWLAEVIAWEQTWHEWMSGRLSNLKNSRKTEECSLYSMFDPAVKNRA